MVDAVTETVRRHTLKYGVDYRRLVTSEELPPLWEVAFYGSEATVLSNQPLGLYVYTQSIDMKAVQHEFSAYVQDDWRVSDRLSLSAGVRWDLNPPPSDLNGNTPYTVNEITNLATVSAAPKEYTAMADDLRQLCAAGWAWRTRCTSNRGMRRFCAWAAGCFTTPAWR